MFNMMRHVRGYGKVNQNRENEDGGKPVRSFQKKKPAWDGTNSDLAAMKLSEHEVVRRRQERLSKHSLLGRTSSSVSTTPDCTQHSRNTGSNSHDHGQAAGVLDGINLNSVLAAIPRFKSPDTLQTPSNPQLAAAPSDDMAYLSDGLVDFDCEVRQFEKRSRAPQCSVPKRLMEELPRSPNDSPLRNTSTGKVTSDTGGRVDVNYTLGTGMSDEQKKEVGRVGPRRSDSSSNSQVESSENVSSTANVNQKPVNKSWNRCESSTYVQNNSKAVPRVGVRKDDKRAPKVNSERTVQGTSLMTRSTVVVKEIDTHDLLSRVTSLEQQLSAVFSLKDLVQELHHSVDQLAMKQNDLQSEVVQHCAHTSSLLTSMQAQMSKILGSSHQTTSDAVNRTKQRTIPSHHHTDPVDTANTQSQPPIQTGGLFRPTSSHSATRRSESQPQTINSVPRAPSSELDLEGSEHSEARWHSNNAAQLRSATGANDAHSPADSFSHTPSTYSPVTTPRNWNSHNMSSLASESSPGNRRLQWPPASTHGVGLRPWLQQPVQPEVGGSASRGDAGKGDGSRSLLNSTSFRTLAGSARARRLGGTAFGEDAGDRTGRCTHSLSWKQSGRDMGSSPGHSITSSLAPQSDLWLSREGGPDRTSSPQVDGDTVDEDGLPSFSAFRRSQVKRSMLSTR